MKQQWDVFNVMESSRVPVARVTTEGDAHTPITDIQPADRASIIFLAERALRMPFSAAVAKHSFCQYARAKGLWPPAPPPHPNLEFLANQMSGKDVDIDGSRAHFWSGAAFVSARIVESTGRVRVKARFPHDAEAAVDAWLQRQPRSPSGLLLHEVDEDDEGTTLHFPMLWFERSHVNDWRGDPLADEVTTYLEAWETDTVADPPAMDVPWAVTDDPRDRTPESAWLLMGDEASYPRAEELREANSHAQAGVFFQNWTAAPTTRRGDLVLVYFMSPRKAVHFVARAASDAYFSRDFDVNSHSEVSSIQWWADITPPVEIEPVTFARLRDAVGGHLILKGRSGHLLDPRTIAKLDLFARDPRQQREVDRVAVTPAGLVKLPKPEQTSFDQWKAISSGSLRLEADVSRHIVEPLLAALLSGSGVATVKAEYRIGRRSADFVIIDRDDQPIHVIEVKKRVRRALHQDWIDTPDFQQVSSYAEELGVPSTLIDAHRLIGFGPLASAPRLVLDRPAMNLEDLVKVRDHLFDNLPGRRRGRYVIWPDSHRAD